MIGRMPGLAAVVIVSLGVGIGVNTAVFSSIGRWPFSQFPAWSMAAAFSSSSEGGRNQSGLVVARTATCASGCGRCPICSRSDGAVQRR
jgi:hypothetical protein